MTAAKPCTCGHDWAAHGPTGCFACECPREEQICQGSDIKTPGAKTADKKKGK